MAFSGVDAANKDHVAVCNVNSGAVRHVTSPRGLAIESWPEWSPNGDRIAFVRKYFQADAMDPLNYDLVINTEKVGIEGAVDTILIAFRDWTKSCGEGKPSAAKRAGAH